MRASEIQRLFRYNYWATGRVLEAASRVSEERFLAPARVSHGSLRGTLAHILGTEWVWRSRYEGGVSPARVPIGEDFPTLEALRARWGQEETANWEFLNRLSDEDLDRTVRYTNTSGIPFENPLWELLLHVVNHGTQFRSEAAVVLTEYGQSPGDLDFILFLRQQG